MKSNLFMWIGVSLSLLFSITPKTYSQEDRRKHPLEYPLDSILSQEKDFFQFHPEQFKPDNSSPLYELSPLSPAFQSQPVTKYSQYYKFALPASFVAYGVLSRAFHPIRELDNSIHDQVNKRIHFKMHVDDFLQYAPAVAVYAVGLAPIKPKHSFRDRTFVMATSYMLMAGTVQLMKRNIHAERPDGFGTNSFPSGHTATAFTGAHILFREYKDQCLWIGVAGYATASATGIMRMVNKRHWLSDVVTGAGIGMLCAEAGYLLLPVFHNILGVKNDNKTITVAPMLYQTYGLSAAYRF